MINVTYLVMDKQETRLRKVVEFFCFPTNSVSLCWKYDAPLLSTVSAIIVWCMRWYWLVFWWRCV